jgi:hypothetical protein
MRRTAPAVALFFLSPLVAEYLLGDFTLTMLPLLILLAPMYGGGALVIREVTRRTGRGWPTMVLLALAYGVFEEGLTTQSLFDPGYAGAHLLDHGFVPALGIAIPWTLDVLALHTVWSISVPIALVEEATVRRTTPWLRTPGLVAGCVLLALGAAGTTAISYGTDRFIAPWPRLAAVVLVVVALVVAAFRVPRTVSPRPGVAPGPWTVFGVALAGGVLFMGVAKVLPTWPGVVAMLVAFGGVGAALVGWSRRSGWDGRHRLAAAAGGLLTYAWHSFLMEPVRGGGDVITPVSHAVFALAAVALLLWEVRHLPRRAAVPAPAAGSADLSGTRSASAGGSVDLAGTRPAPGGGDVEGVRSSPGGGSVDLLRAQPAPGGTSAQPAPAGGDVDLEGVRQGSPRAGSMG